MKLSSLALICLTLYLPSDLALPNPIGGTGPGGSSDTEIKDLVATGPSPELKDKLMLFGQFVGDWKAKVLDYFPNGVVVNGDMQIHIRWILNGTAIQDVFEGTFTNLPPGFPPVGPGTTIRQYDKKLDAWHVFFFSPTDNAIQVLLGRKVGDKIVLETKTQGSSYPEHWVFSEITPTSFHWYDEESHDGGKTWVRTEDFYAQRVTGGS